MAKKAITGKQRAARKRNIKVARMAKKKGGGISSREAERRGLHHVVKKKMRQENRATAKYLKKLNTKGTIHYRKPKRVSYKKDMVFPSKADYIRAGVKPPKGAR